MDTDLVKLAQNGDKGAFTTLAAARADRYLAASHRILRDFSLAEDATQQALLSIWRDLPQLRDPARFDAWSYRLLVRACYAEASQTRRWTPNIRLLPADEPMAAGCWAPNGESGWPPRNRRERGGGTTRHQSVSGRGAVEGPARCSAAPAASRPRRG